MLTSDAITDDQIRELRDWARRLISDAQFALLRGGPDEIRSPTLLREVNEARVRCAEINKARQGHGGWSAAAVASDQAQFAAREFVARFEREMGAEAGAVVRDRMLFAYEMGYLRGHGEGMRAVSAIYDEKIR